MYSLLHKATRQQEKKDHKKNQKNTIKQHKKNNSYLRRLLNDRIRMIDKLSRLVE